jgi:hypothetical protein
MLAIFSKDYGESAIIRNSCFGLFKRTHRNTIQRIHTLSPIFRAVVKCDHALDYTGLGEAA